MANDVPTLDSNTGLPRLPSHEATAASRGFVAGWAQAIDAILKGGDDDVVYVEAFEDVVVIAASGEVGGIQIKDKAGAFSITQEEPCGMLERWASVIERRPSSWFRFCSTQTAGNLHDRSTSFPRWVAGDRSDTVLTELRESLSKFMSGKHKGRFERLERLAQDPAVFKQYWSGIDWRLGGVGLSELMKSLLEEIGKHFPADVEPSVRQHRLFSWIGALAVSASSENIEDRRWTKKRLFTIDPKADVRLALIASLLDRLIGDKVQEHAKILTEILETVRRCRNSVARFKKLSATRGRKTANLPSVASQS